jgi:hypothetical protein
LTRIGFPKMPAGLLKVLAFGFVLFFLGAALVGWVYG